MKSGFEIQFEQLCDNLQKQIDLYKSSQPIHLKRRQDKITSFFQKLKELKNVLRRIENEFKNNARIKIANQFDLKNRLKKYMGRHEILLKSYEALNLKLQEDQRKELMAYRTQQQVSNMKLAQENEMKLIDIHRDAGDTHEMASNIKQQLVMQGNTLGGIRQDIQISDGELGVIGELTRIMKNRNLISKLILVFWIIFLAIVDCLLLIIKIM